MRHSCYKLNAFGSMEVGSISDLNARRTTQKSYWRVSSFFSETEINIFKLYVRTTCKKIDRICPHKKGGFFLQKRIVRPSKLVKDDQYFALTRAEIIARKADQRVIDLARILRTENTPKFDP